MTCKSRAFGTMTRSAFVLAFLAVFAIPAVANEKEQEAACTGDALKFCASEIPDKAKVEVCMKKNQAKLSPACQAQFK